MNSSHITLKRNALFTINARRLWLYTRCAWGICIEETRICYICFGCPGLYTCDGSTFLAVPANGQHHSMRGGSPDFAISPPPSTREGSPRFCDTPLLRWGGSSRFCDSKLAVTWLNLTSRATAEDKAQQASAPEPDDRVNKSY